MPAPLEADLLQTFVAIAEAGTFTDAAHRLNRTQSAVSMQIKRLEEQLTRPVFIREGRTVRLSRDGEILLGHARRILRAHQEALAEFVETDLRGTVSLGIIDEYAVAFLPGFLSRFAETHPLVHVEVVCDTSINLIPRVAAGGLDFAVITHGHGNDGGTVLMREPVVWVGSAYHCAHERDPVPLALFHEGCRFRRWAIEALARNNRGYRLAYTSVSLAGILAAINGGLAIGALPRSNVTPGLRMLTERDGFPPLPEYEMALLRSDNATAPVHDHLERHIIEDFCCGTPVAPAA